MKKSLFDDHQAPTKLWSRAVTAEEDRCLFGYSIRELATEGCVAGVLYLSLTGDLPTRCQLRAFEIGFLVISAVSIESGPVHAASLARLCGADPSAIQGIAALALAEQAASLLEEAYSSIEASLPQRRDVAATELGERVRAKLGDDAGQFVAWQLPVSDFALGVHLLVESGISKELLPRALVLARLPVASAEAFAHRANGFFKEYPFSLPAVEYDHE